MWGSVFHSECGGRGNMGNISWVCECVFEAFHHFLIVYRLNSQASLGPGWQLLVEFQPSSEDEFSEEPAVEWSSLADPFAS